MRYLITPKTGPPFLTKWFNPENIEPGMIVFDLSMIYNLSQITYTTDGINWEEIETDEL